MRVPECPEDLTPVLQSADELTAYLEAGCKPPDRWKIGTEHEKFVFYRRDLSPVPYDGPYGIRVILEKLAARTGWTPVTEDGLPVGLKGENASISLEPGGQFELSGAPVDNIHETCDEAHRHLELVKAVCRPLDVAFLGAGFAPTWKLEDMPHMPKSRYDIMRRYMPGKGMRGLDMMHRTCTIQVNLDFSSEADMVRKFRASVALQPVATALFANSALYESRRSGFVSGRARVWTDTDPDRTGIPEFVFEDGFGFGRYTEYVLDVPMYFVRRGGRYIDVAGQSFRDFLAGKLPALPGLHPVPGDWEDHLSTVFPEVRLKTFLEMRGADAGPWSRICALSAFWTGLLYDSGTLDAALDMMKGRTADDRRQLLFDAAKYGLKAKAGNRTMQDMAREALSLSREGLRRRRRAGNRKRDETSYLDPLDRIADSGETPGELTLRLFEKDRDYRKLFEGGMY